MKRFLETAALWAFGLLILFAWGGCVRWEYRECKKVGHGSFYCVIHLSDRNKR